MKHVRKWWWLLPVLLFDFWLIGRWTGCVPERRDEREGVGCSRRKTQPAVAEREFAAWTVTFPTLQTNLVQTHDATVFMPTASGRVQSALYGSTRTRLRGGHAVAAFHEGIDIAPLARDAAGRALDDVVAIADGTLVYAHRNGGGSSYGQYVVIEHVDPIGPVYSLYSHLDAVDRDVRNGMPVQRGRVIGRMGHSSTLGIPRSRSHLHFEVDLLLNQRFEAWCRKHKMDTRHGIHHGWNLTGIDPLALYPTTAREQSFRLDTYLAALPTAFTIALRTDRPLDYFARYATLWQGPTPSRKTSTATLAVSHGGVITAGRPATSEEHARLRGRRYVVIEVDTDVLGRNGVGLIARNKGSWELTRTGNRWLDILTH